MNTSFSTIILLLATTTTGLAAGLFYSYSCSVNPGLGKLSDPEYIRAMQSINREILNPVFFLSFMGTCFLLPWTAYLHYSTPASTSFWLLIAASVVYIIGTFGVTMAGNVPLNNMLEAFNVQSASAGEIAKFRSSFEEPWNNLHQVRTIAAVVSLVLAVLACINRSSV
jgi:uncharacterized membrane protein